MKKTAIYKKSLKLIFLGFIFLSASPLFADEPFVFVYSEQFPPYSWRENKQNLGIIIDVVNEALVKRLKLKIRYKAVPWARAQRMVRNGKADAFISVSSAKRKTYTFASSESILTTPLSFFVIKGFPKVEQLSNAQSFEELKEFRFVSNRGNGIWEEKLKDVKVDWLNRRSQIPVFLEAGRGDIWPEVAHVGRYILKQAEGKNNIIEIPLNIPIPTQPFLLHIGKNSEYVSLIPQFDETIREIKREGVLQKIVERYD